MKVGFLSVLSGNVLWADGIGSENFRIENVVEAVKYKSQRIHTLGGHSQGKGKKKSQERMFQYRYLEVEGEVGGYGVTQETKERLLDQISSRVIAVIK